MKEEIKKFLTEYNTSKGWGISDNDLRETLYEASEVYRKFVTSHRHWDEIWIVVKIEDKYFCYDYAHSTGDMSINELGWEFDTSSVAEVSKKTKVVEITTYE